jgi:transcriptional regulator with XRE-family HTH domain
MTQFERLRKQAHMTQVELAEALGVTQSNISQWENGTAFPSASKLPIIAKTLDCTIDALYDKPDEPA